MKYLSDIYVQKSCVWAESGLLFKTEPSTYGSCVLKVESLNPSTQFRRVLSRGDLVRIGVWFIFQALRFNYKNPPRRK